jgi:hypothetical protein
MLTEKDMAEFVKSNSDFAFEMRVLSTLRELGFDCSHSGTYSDPITKKIRQFDIRAVKDHVDFTLALAVECKNFHQDNPLLLSAVPRVEAEAFHDIFIYNPEGLYKIWQSRISGNQSKYKPGRMVGKQTDQVKRDGKGTLFSDDEKTFDKLNQAVNSCRDLIEKAASNPASKNSRAVVPLLVVPTDLLWQVDYSEDGRIRTPPRPVKEATLFIDHCWSFDNYVRGYSFKYTLSHIEFATIDALPGVVEGYFGPGRFFPR